MIGDPSSHIRIPDLNCPFCGEGLDCTTAAYEEQPSTPTPEAVSLCVFCGQFGIFTVGPLGMAIRLPTAEEVESILAQHGAYIDYLKQTKQIAWTGEPPCP